MKKICVYSHKGGIGKTTLAYHLGVQLAQLGKRVLLVDGDPQCNLSAFFLGDEYETFYANDKPTIYNELAVAFHAKAKPLSACPTAEHHNHHNLYLLPGNMRIATFELSLTLAQTSSFMIFGNLPGAIQFVIGATAKSVNAEYVIIDTSPSISSFNLNYWYGSSHFLIPCNNTIFSDMALESLSEIFPVWKESGDRIAMRSNYTYKFNLSIPKFLGFVATHGHHSFLPSFFSKGLIESMRETGLLLEGSLYRDVLGNESYELDYDDVAQGVINLTNS